MPNNLHHHRRRSLRLPGYDYTKPGGYFVTVRVRGGAKLLGHVVAGEMHPNRYGRILQDCWARIPVRFPHAIGDAFVVMPNHVHGVVILAERTPGRGTASRAPTGNHDAASELLPACEQFGRPVPGSLPTTIRSFKSAVTRRINILRDTPGGRVWQRGFYEHMVRDEADLAGIREYVLTNPARWREDRYYREQ